MLCILRLRVRDMWFTHTWSGRLNAVLKYNQKKYRPDMTKFNIFHEHANSSKHKCVDLVNIMLKYHTVFDSCVAFDTLDLAFIGVYLTFTSKTDSLTHVSDKVLVAK